MQLESFVLRRRAKPQGSLFPLFYSLFYQGEAIRRIAHDDGDKGSRATMSDGVGIAIRLEDGCGLLQKCGNAGQNFVSCCPEETTCTSANDNTYV